MLVILIGITLTAGSANALNMYFDRDIDEIMKAHEEESGRCRSKSDHSSRMLLFLASHLGVIATALLALVSGNPLSCPFRCGHDFFLCRHLYSLS